MLSASRFQRNFHTLLPSPIAGAVKIVRHHVACRPRRVLRDSSLFRLKFAGNLQAFLNAYHPHAAAHPSLPITALCYSSIIYLAQNKNIVKHFACVAASGHRGMRRRFVPKKGAAAVTSAHGPPGQGAAAWSAVDPTVAFRRRRCRRPAAANARRFRDRAAGHRSTATCRRPSVRSDPLPRDNIWCFASRLSLS